MWWFKKSKKENLKQYDEIQLIKLITVRNSYELGIVESILKDNEIPYIPKEEGASGYLRITTGGVFNSVDIMVEQTQYQKAKDLVEPIFMEETGEE